MLKQGEIYRGKVEHRKDNVYHPLVCLEDETKDKTFVEACVLTHSSQGKTYQNIPLCKNHFLENDEDGKPYSFRFENTCLVQKAFKKQVFWIEENCVGKLSKLGIDFVLQHRPQFGPAIDHSKRLNGE